MRQSVLRSLEIVLLIAAFSIVIPPFPSEAETQFNPLPMIVLGACCLAACLALACRRGGEHWGIALLKLILFCGFALVVFLRV